MEMKDRKALLAARRTFHKTHAQNSAVLNRKDLKKYRLKKQEKRRVGVAANAITTRFFKLLQTCKNCAFRWWR